MKLCPSCAVAFDRPEWSCPRCSYQPETVAGFPAFAPELSAADNSFDAASFARLAAANDSHFWFRARRRLLLWTLRRYFADAESFLEIGCGDGHVLAGVHRALPRARLIGSELISDGLAFTARRLDGRAALFQMDARAIPYADEIDVIGAFDVIEHIEDDETVLAEMYRACRPGGGIVLTVPQHRFLWSPADEAAHHYRRYEANELRAKVRRAGFEIVRETSFMAVLMPPLYLARLRARRKAGYSVSTDELSVSAWANRLLYGVTRLDQSLIELGVDLPFGSSRMLAARKPAARKPAAREPAAREPA